MTVPEGYYSFLREEIRPLLPPVRGARVLEIGCGMGETSACRLMETGRLRIRPVLENVMQKKKYRRIDRMTFGLHHDFFVYQFLIASTIDLPPVGEAGG